jgi:regulator of cell morphogenesis and NO signaling
MVVDTPAIAEVFEELDIDYFCRGNRSLPDALNERGVSLEDFKRECEGASRRSDGRAAVPDWRAVPLRRLINHIVDTHHAFLHRELPALDKYIVDHHPRDSVWPPALVQVFQCLKRDMEVHMRKEETILFPTIVDMQTAVASGRRPRALPFGSVANFSRVLEQEHRRTAGVLHEIRVLTNNYTCAPAASDNLQTVYRRLQAMAADVHQHIHLENNILFPRAIDLEKGELLCQ